MWHKDEWKSVVIQVENISKQYRIGTKVERARTLGEAVGTFISSPIRNMRRLRGLTTFREEDEQDVIWALKDVSFEVKAGEVVGIIGRNGAGKSTLLKVLSRITPPTRGKVKIDGRVSSLLEVGTGFHPELTGRENIYLNGTILGMRKSEVDRKFEEIVEFSGISKFIDTPVKRYSSGMSVRLAFSVAAHLEPEVLIVDEVLAVGDVEFQQRSFEKMNSVATGGRTVLLVSHNMNAIKQLCDNALIIEQGRLNERGDADFIVKKYLNTYLDTKSHKPNEIEYTVKDDTAELIEVNILDSSNQFRNTFQGNEDVNILVRYRLLSDIRRLRVGLRLYSSDGGMLFTTTNWDDATNSMEKQLMHGCYIEKVTIPANLLNVGQYLVSVTADWPMHKVIFITNPHYAFEIHEVGSVGVQCDDKRPGYFRPLLKWKHMREDV